MSEELGREFCVIAFRIDFPEHRLVSEKYRGKLVTVTYDGESFKAWQGGKMPETAADYGKSGMPETISEELSGFDKNFAEIYFRHSGTKDYYENA